PETLSFGKYRYVVDLGSGGMGDVFLAVAQGPQGFNKLQVIKRLRPELAQDPEFLSMFLNEARIAARLNHPNVVQTNEVSEQDDEYFIAMEYLEGQSLYAIGRRGRIPLALHLHVLAETCAGLHYAHDLLDFDGTPLHLVHRDCSPQNVFVTYEGEVKVLDFGIAKAADSATVTRTGVLKGKVPYMAPEQLDGKNVDRRADVFAVGAMLWEAAVGSRLWKGLNDMQIAHRLHHGQIPRPSDFEPNVDPNLQAIVMKALALDPEDRYATAAELQAAIESYVSRLGGINRRDVGKFVTRLFLDTRKSLRAKIEDELRGIVPSWRSLLASTGEQRAMQSGEHAAFPSQPSEAPSTSTSGERSIVPPRTPSGRTPVRPPRGPESNAELSAETEVPPSLASGLDHPMIGPTDPSLLTQRSTTVSLFPDRRRGARGRAMVVAGCGALVAGVLAFVVLRGRSPEPKGEEQAGAAKPASAEKSAKEPEIQAPEAPTLHVSTEPKGAAVWLDGRILDRLEGKELAVGSRHEIHAELAGYTCEKHEFVTVGAQNIWKLTCTPNTAPSGTGASKQPGSVAPLPVPSSSAKTPKAILDTTDPWKN
ncbi:MAG: serine/threonine protein kinase, partial [Polyangiales bacterium]